MIKTICIKDITVGKNIRSEKDTELAELAKSIETQGLINPITVKQIGLKYKVIAGHRRLAACKLLGMDKVPCSIEDAESDSLMLTIHENLHRKDMNAIEWCEVFDRLKAERGYTDIRISKELGKSGQWVQNIRQIKKELNKKYGDNMPVEIKKAPLKVQRKLAVTAVKGGGRNFVEVGYTYDNTLKLYRVFARNKKAEKELCAFLADWREKWQN